jgi:hypothetical protein
MPAAQLGVGGYSEVAPDAGSGIPVRPVGHDAGSQVAPKQPTRRACGGSRISSPRA